MGYEKDYDLRFGNFFVSAFASVYASKVMSFHRSFGTKRIAKKFVIYSHSVLLSIEFVVNSGK